jgi:hypothetical protein
VPKPRLVTIDAFSYSRLSTYTQCPRKAKYTAIDKLREPNDAPALVNGNKVHFMANVWVTGRLPKFDRESLQFKTVLEKTLADRKANKVPHELATFEEEFRGLQKLGNTAVVEDQWAFDREWNYLGPQGWFSKQAWLRIKVDLHYLKAMKVKRTLNTTTANIVDYKTGKFNPEHGLQRSLYALGALLVYPDVANVTVAHWYLDAGREGGPEAWTREQLPALKEEWLRRTKAMLSDTTFAPNPTDKCKWCWFRKANGGPCEF